MKLSNSEYKFKSQLAQNEIEPENYVWDNIQKELEQNRRRKISKIWFKYAGIAAILCISFLMYQILMPVDMQYKNVVLDSKPLMTKPIKFNSIRLGYVAHPKTYKIEPDNNLADNHIQQVDNQKPNQSLQIEVTENSIDDETESLLQLAHSQLQRTEQERQLIQEVNTLLAQAIKNTQDVEQKGILQNLEAKVLLAEVESEIKLQKPQNLKDKIWDALVTNLNDLKNTIALN